MALLAFIGLNCDAIVRVIAFGFSSKEIDGFTIGVVNDIVSECELATIQSK